MIDSSLIEELIVEMKRVTEKLYPSGKWTVEEFCELHKGVSYCEVIIHPDGLIEYAVPSHTEKLIQVCMDKFSATREEIFEEGNKTNLIPAKFLCDKSGCISVWYNYYITPDNVTPEQNDTMIKLSNYSKRKVVEFKWTQNTVQYV